MFLLVVALTPTARATNFVLNTCDAQDLIDAINDANNEGANPGEDTITLKAGCTGASAYELTTANFTDADGPTGLPKITSDIVIEGNDSEIIRDSADQFRIFHVASGASLTLNHVIVKYGETPDGDNTTPNTYNGGGILSYGDLTLNHSTLDQNATGDAYDDPAGSGGYSGAGGGICSLYGSVVLNSSFVTNNHTGNGGDGGAGNGGGSGRGGGLYAEGSTVAITGGQFNYNYTGDGGEGDTGGNSGDGGAISYAHDTVLVIKDASFTGNYTGNGGEGSNGQIGGDSGSGGAIWSAGGLDLDKVSFQDNNTGEGGHGEYEGGNAGDGGAIYLTELAPGATIKNSFFSENNTGNGGSASEPDYTSGGNGGDGGAIYAAYSLNGSAPTNGTGELEIVNSEFNTNYTGDGGNAYYFSGWGGSGGAIWIFGVLDCKDTTFLFNNTGDGGSANGDDGYGGMGGFGGAVNSLGTLYVDNCDMSNNSTGNGGDGFTAGGEGGPGGAIFFSSNAFDLPGYDSGVATIHDSVFEENDTGRGGLTGFPDGTPQYGGHGGAIANTGTMSVTLSLFESNETGLGGVQDKPENGTETSLGGMGGGIMNLGFGRSIIKPQRDQQAPTQIPAQGWLFVDETTFKSNVGTGGGGAIANVGGYLKVARSTFEDNETPLNGGGITNTLARFTTGLQSNEPEVNNNSLNFALTVVNSTFSGNDAGEAGGGIYHGPNILAAPAGSGTIANVTNVTLVNNSAEFGGGVFADTVIDSAPNIPVSPELTLFNTLLAQNTSGGNCDGNIADGGGNLEDQADCGFTQPTSQSNANPGLDPNGLQENGGPTKTIAILENSDALHKGVESICEAASGYPDFGADGIDQRSVTRPQGPQCDIGAFEAQFGTDVGIEKDGKVGGAGNTIVWNLAVTNHGPLDANNVILRDPLPDSVDFVSAETTQGTCSYNAAKHLVLCKLGSMNVGDWANIEIKTKRITDDKVFENVARVRLKKQPDLNKQNNKAKSLVQLGQP